MTGQVQNNLRRESLVAVAYDGGDAGDCGQFLRGALGIAAGDDDASFWIEAMGAADEGTRRTVGLGGDAAGVDYDDVGCIGIRLVEPGVT